MTKNVKINHDISIITNITIISIGISLIIHSIGKGNPNTSNSLIFNKLQQQKQQGPPQINSSLLAALFTTGNQENKNIGNLNNNSSKAVILTFGDGYQSQYTVAKPILDKYGFKGNFFVTYNKVGLESKITWQELAQLYKEGHTIGSKTMNYGTKVMEGKDFNHLSAKDLDYEIGGSKQCLLDHGINTTFLRYL